MPRDEPRWGRRRGDELPAELERREQRLQTIRAAKAVLEESPGEAASGSAHGRVTDRPRRGRPPHRPGRTLIPSPAQLH